MVFVRKDLHRKCRPRNGRKGQNGQNSRVKPIIYVQSSDFKILDRLLCKMKPLEKKKATKKMVFGRKDLNYKCRRGNGQKSQNGQNSRV